MQIRVISDLYPEFKGTEVNASIVLPSALVLPFQ